MIYLYVALGILFALLYLVETLGYAIRESGRTFGVTALGYSLHTQFGTVARMSTLIAMPVIGYLLDADTPPEQMILIPIATAVFYTLAMLLVLSNVATFLGHSERFFKWYINKLYGVNATKQHQEVTQIGNSRSETRKIAIASFLSFFIVVVGVFSTIVLASIFHDHRATIMQSSVVFTSLGTFVSIFLFDPRISNIIDAGGDFKSLLRVIFISRVVAMFIVGFVLAIIHPSLWK